MIKILMRASILNKTRGVDFKQIFYTERKSAKIFKKKKTGIEFNVFSKNPLPLRSELGFAE